MEFVILVDENDNALGTMEKMEAHEKGLLHRAFSIFIFNKLGQMLIHQRALDKYHCGGLWTNACCSHPRMEETVKQAAHRRLKEEMGFDCELIPLFQFKYRAELDKGLTEHEYDHVLFGTFNDLPAFNPQEVMAVKYVELEELYKDVKLNPDLYTPWFRIALEQLRVYDVSRLIANAN